VLSGLFYLILSAAHFYTSIKAVLNLLQGPPIALKQQQYRMYTT
jgi:hypothetical protein